jgi:diguanylate cyclase (GGDEF)-like protein
VGLLVAGLKRTLARERALSRTDPLCSLLNSRAFYEDGDRLLALCRRGGRPVTLAYIDLDDFKATNDSLGHSAGDELLCIVARTLQSSARSSDIVARLGGDEFAMMLPEVGPDQARHALERIRDALTQRTSDPSCAVSVSIGAVTFMTVPDDLHVMVQVADAIMYSAKDEGKGRLRLEVVEAPSPVDASTRVGTA